jgi:hypothetical protein
MPIDKKVANKVLSTLDNTAQRLEGLKTAGKIDPRIADGLVREIDAYADRFQVAAFGEESLRRFQSKVLKKDGDEKYMDTFENPNKVIQSDSDEPYMHKAPPSFNSKGVDTYDQDNTTTVSDRKEYDVRDLSEMSTQSKQPSWPGGSAGKSTKQGAVAPRRPAPKASPSKTWA